MFPKLAEIGLALQLALAPCVPDAADGAFYVSHAKRAAILHWAPQRQHLWCALVALAGAESRWTWHAVSGAGAEGSYQVMRATWDARAAEGGLYGSPYDPWVAARVAAVHMERLAKFWSAPRPDFCRLKLQIASYNAGEGNIEAAQALSGGEPCWEGIAPYLPAVTGRHAAETIAFVARWEGIFLDLTGLEELPP